MKKLMLVALPLAAVFLFAEYACNSPSPLPFSPSVRSGQLVFVSGQIGMAPGAGEFAGEDIESQTARALENISAILEDEHGIGMDKVVKTTVFLKNIGDYDSMNRVYSTYFPERKPARSTVAVAGLARGALIEVEAIAELGR